MVEEGFSWIYLIFFLIPLARILPRIVKKWKNRNSPPTENQFNQNETGTEQKQESFQRQESFQKPQNKETQVLGELNQGVRDFNKIQRNLNMENQELENILKDLEDKGLMKVIKKKGIAGVKVELYPTDEGFKKYYS
ncbi:MAG: hypothetical protein ISR80_03465 [Nitrosopumilus sp.]|nr:hypothetical protein [Nitrosopumilus sp.]MDC4231686.1 hypothetical protein [Nitrosopumilus sp.]